MNLEQLIYLVSQKPSIWDKRKKSHGSRQVVDKCWKEISEEMKVDETSLRKKWKYLRDQYCVELGKVQQGAVSKWLHYEMLAFLKDAVAPRTILRGQSLNPGINKQDWEDTSSDSDYGPRKQKTESVNQNKRVKLEISKKKKSESVLETLEIDNSYQERYVVEEEDEHLHFFKSLLPHVRSIPRSKLLSFRSRIQSVVEEFAYENLIRKKWRYLRDQFCVELGKVQATGTESKWPNYEMLTFLRDTVTPRTTPSILRRQGIIPYSIEDWADTSSESDNISLKTKSVSQSTRKNFDSLRNKMRDSVVPEVAEMVAVTNQEKFVAEEENEHLYFFKSLLPHVRSIPRSKLLSFRSRIQSIVEEFAYGGSSSFVECVSSNDSPMYHPEGPDPIYKPDE